MNIAINCIPHTFKKKKKNKLCILRHVSDTKYHWTQTHHSQRNSSHPTRASVPEQSNPSYMMFDSENLKQCHCDGIEPLQSIWIPMMRLTRRTVFVWTVCRSNDVNVICICNRINLCDRRQLSIDVCAVVLWWFYADYTFNGFCKLAAFSSVLDSDASHTQSSTQLDVVFN